jgi:predicted  nucleic acid-binding Zn-ribbon protein
MSLEERLEANATQYAKATANVVGEANNVHFKDATEKLMRWSEDQVAAVTHKIEVLRARQLEVERAIRQSKTLDEQVPLQKEFDEIRRKIRRARVEVADIEDETDAKRRSLLDALQRKLIPEINHETLFSLRWKVI